MFHSLDMLCVELFQFCNDHIKLKLEQLLSIGNDDGEYSHETFFALVLALWFTSLSLTATVLTIADLLFHACVLDSHLDEFRTGHKVQDNHLCKEVWLVIQAPPHL